MRFLFIFILFAVTPAKSEEKTPCAADNVTGATVYVPLYSHIYFGDALKPFNLAATVSIRNIDQQKMIKIVQADYYDSTGKLIRSFLDKPITLDSLASYSFKVKESDIEGGSGASVLIRWNTQETALAPIIESVMIGTAQGQGISFSSRGTVISSEYLTKNLKSKN